MQSLCNVGQCCYLLIKAPRSKALPWQFKVLLGLACKICEVIGAQVNCKKDTCRLHLWPGINNTTTQPLSVQLKVIIECSCAFCIWIFWPTNLWSKNVGSKPFGSPSWRFFLGIIISCAKLNTPMQGSWCCL